MTLLVDDRAALRGEPGLHALLVGVSAYPHLPGGSGAPAPDSYGMGQLTSPALTIFRLADWLRQHRAAMPAPLATCRTLVSASPREIAIEPGLADFGGEATTDAFLRAARDWREDASAHSDNVTVFYFVGHGVQETRDNVIMLLADFGDGVGGILRKAVDTDSLREGMAPAAARPDIARTQFYFIDACRTYPDEFRNFATLEWTRVFDVEFTQMRDDRRAPIFFAAVPGSTAYSIDGEPTLFSQALFACLDGGGGVLTEIEGDERWNVSISSLSRALTNVLAGLNARERADQDFDATGSWRDPDTPLVFLDHVPEVDVVVELQPPDAVARTRVHVVDRGGTEVPLPNPLQPHPYRCRWPAGYYTFRTDPPPLRPGTTGVPRPVFPPEYRWNPTVPA